jgi:hypothetical protein
MSTPVGRPAKSNILDYAPRHVREGGGPRRVDEDATPPLRPVEEEPLDDAGADDEGNDAPLAPEAPRDGDTGDADQDRDDATDAESYPHEATGQDADDRHSSREESEFDRDIAQLSELLETIRRDNEASEPPPAAFPRRAGVPPPVGSVRDVYIDGMRVPRSLQPSYVEPPPEPEHRGSYGKIIGGVTGACLLAAALAFVMVVNWHPTPPAAVQSSAPARQDAAVFPDRTATRAVDRPQLAGTSAPYSVASAGTSAEAAPAAATQQASLTAAPAAAHTVPVVRVAPTQAPTQAPWPAVTPSNPAPKAAPAAPAWPAAPPGSAAQPPPPPRQQPAMDAQEITLLLDQGKQFISVGDLATARTVLQRVADANVAAGALALAETYDPAMLAKLGVRGLQGDAEQARRWYERARELGSDEAAHRLELMASQ